MGASLADYFELEESSESEENDPSLLESSIPENDPSTSQENASSEQASLIGDDATDSNPSAQEEHPDTDNPSLADDGAPLTDAGTAEDGSPIENGTEIPGLQKLPEYASVAENTDSYAAPGHAESNETEGKEPPEGTANNTE